MQGENMRVRKLIALLIVVSTILTVFITNPNQVNAATSTMLARDVEYVGSTQIKSMISSLNIDRTSGGGHYIENGNKVYVKSSALVHSKSLQYIAEQRAAELLMKYDYVRPNGKQFNTLSNNSITSDFERFFTSDKLLSGQEIYNKWFNVGTAESAKYLLSDIYKSIGVACLKYNNKYYYVIELSTKTDSSVANISDCKVNKNIEYDPSVVPIIYKMSSEEISAKIGERSLVYPYLYGYRGQVMEYVYPFGNDSSKITVKLSAYNSNEVSINDYLCTPKKAGRIRVKASFYYDGSLFFADDAYLNTSTVSISDSNVVITSESAFYTGAAVVPKITVKYKDCVFTEGVDYKIVNPKNNINCSDTTNASVDIQGIGSLTGTKKYEYKIKPIDIPAVVSITNPVYNGMEQTPSVKITFNGKTLVEGKDYEFYVGFTNAGTYQTYVSGMGNFSPNLHRIVDYKILPYTIKDSQVGTISNQIYTGSTIEPDVKIVVNNTTLKKGEDYSISYSNRYYVGSSTATITFKGNYTSEKPIVRNFQIVTPTPTATPKPTATPTATATPKPTAIPTATPVVTVKPTATPVVTVKPTVAPTTTPVVTVNPVVTTEPKPTATATPSEAVKPTAIPTAVPVVTSNPVVTEPKPTATNVPSATNKPTATPVIMVKPIVTSEPMTTATVAPSSTKEPVARPTSKPTIVPTVESGTNSTTVPTTKPSNTVTTVPTSTPTGIPADKPTVETTKAPSVEDFAERLYTTCLGRDAEKEGKEYWVSELKAGKPGSEVAEGFFFSPEFVGFNLDNEEYITRLYRTFMGREPDKNGIDYWSSEMNNGKDRKFVFDGFVNSPEWANICLTYGIRSGGLTAPTFEKEASDAVKAFAERLYTTCLGREAEKEGLEWWAAELANLRQTGTVAASGFFNSPEFIGLKTDDNEYVTRLYKTFMGRDPEEAGFEFWTSELKSGKDRQYVFDGFSVAPEFANLCAEAGIMR